MKLDEIDLKTLDALRKNGRTPFVEIGSNLGIADSTVHSRVEKMVDEGVIKQFTVKLDNEALGRISCLLMLDVIPGHLEEVVQTLIQDERIEEIFEIHGSYVAILKITSGNLNEIRDEITKIRKTPNITRSEMATILKVWKDM